MMEIRKQFSSIRKEENQRIFEDFGNKFVLVEHKTWRSGVPPEASLYPTFTSQGDVSVAVADGGCLGQGSSDHH